MAAELTAMFYGHLDCLDFEGNDNVTHSELIQLAAREEGKREEGHFPLLRLSAEASGRIANQLDPPLASKLAQREKREAEARLSRETVLDEVS